MAWTKMSLYIVSGGVGEVGSQRAAVEFEKRSRWRHGRP